MIEAQPLDIWTEGLYSSYVYGYPMESQQTLFRYSTDLDLASQKVAGIPLNQGAKKLAKDNKGKSLNGWRKGKTYEYIYGPEKAEEIRKKVGRIKYAKILTKEFLKTEHIFNKKPLTVISNELGISIWTIHGYMKRYNLPQLGFRLNKKRIMSSDTRKIKSELMKKKWKNKEFREKRLKILDKYLHTDEVATKIRQSLKQYYSNHNSPFKGKHIWQNKTHPLLGKHIWQNKTHPRGMLGKISPMRGKHHSLNTRQKMRETRLKLWKNPEYREKTIKATIKSLLKSPTSYERKITSLIKKYNLPFEYTGNGQILIDSLNPDFISTNGKKLIIETYTKWCHIDNYEEVRSERLSKQGYKILFLSDDVLYRNPNWEQICLTKINDFIFKEN